MNIVTEKQREKEKENEKKKDATEIDEEVEIIENNVNTQVESSTDLTGEKKKQQGSDEKEEDGDVVMGNINDDNNSIDSSESEESEIDENYTIDATSVRNGQVQWGLLLKSVADTKVKYKTTTIKSNLNKKFCLPTLYREVKKLLINSKAYNSTEFSIETWKHLFETTIRERENTIGSLQIRNKSQSRINIQQLAAGLAKSSPEVLFKAILKQGKLPDTQLTRVWRASIETLGSRYTTGEDKTKVQSSMEQFVVKNNTRKITPEKEKKNPKRKITMGKRNNKNQATKN